MLHRDVLQAKQIASALAKEVRRCKLLVTQFPLVIIKYAQRTERMTVFDHTVQVNAGTTFIGEFLVQGRIFNQSAQQQKVAAEAEAVELRLELSFKDQQLDAQLQDLEQSKLEIHTLASKLVDAQSKAR